jgi:hypothetical protein
MDEPDRSSSRSSSSRPEPPFTFWTPSQRGVVIGFVLILSVALLIRSLRDRAYISDPQPQDPARFDELADRIDPNVASWQELAVLPQLGEKRARELVAYRDDFLSRGHDTVAFRRAEDLLKVRGFGIAMLATVRPYLMFPTTAPTTAATGPSV